MKSAAERRIDFDMSSAMRRSAADFILGQSRQPSPPVEDRVPEGWVMVPEVPTVDMILAGSKVICAEMPEDYFAAKNGWSAMLSALPAQSPVEDRGEVERLREENERLRGKVEAFTNGDTFLMLRDEDRAKAACDLDDASLVKWVRWALCQSARFYEEDAKKRERSLAEMTTQHGVIALALLALRTNATTATFEVGGITFRNEPKGDWRVTIEQIALPAQPTEGEA